MSKPGSHPENKFSISISLTHKKGIHGQVPPILFWSEQRVTRTYWMSQTADRKRLLSREIESIVICVLTTQP